MNMKEALSVIESYLKQDFEVEIQKPINQMIVPLYASRKAGLGGRDYVFIYNADELQGELIVFKKIHEEDRKYVNAFYKVPKMMRLKVPNIITLFIKNGEFDTCIIDWVQAPTRSAIGGEIHSSSLIDFCSMKAYGQGMSRTQVRGSVSMTLTFTKIDPQNRAFYLLKDMMTYLEDSELQGGINKDH